MCTVEIIGAMNAPVKENIIDVDFVEVKTVKTKRNTRKILSAVKEVIEGIAFVTMFFTLIYGFSFLELLTR